MVLLSNYKWREARYESKMDEKFNQLLIDLHLDQESNPTGYAAFIACNPELNDALYYELLESKLLAEHAIEELLDWMFKRGLLNAGSEIPPLTFSWDQDHNQYIITSKIPGITHKPQISTAGTLPKNVNLSTEYEGREISIRIANTRTNNDLCFTDLEARCLSLFDLSLSLINTSLSPAVVNKLQSYRDRAITALRTILITGGKQTPIKDINLNQVNSIMRTLLVNIAGEIADFTHQDNLKYVANKHDIEEIIRKIYNAEIIQSSNTLRPLVIAAVPLQYDGIHDSQYIVELIEPKSDVSSSLRNTVGKILANWFGVQLTAVTVNKSGAVPKITHKKVIAGDRSASFAKLGTELSYKDTLEMAKRTVIQKARNKIIQQLLTSTYVANRPLTIKSGIITLLSPVIEKINESTIFGTATSNALRAIHKKFAKTLLEGNEAAQLNYTEYVAKHLPNERLEFTTEDIEYIKRHVPPDIVLPDLTSVPIEFSCFAINFPINKIGKTRMASLDLLQLNKKHNKRGIKKLSHETFNYIFYNYNLSKQELAILTGFFDDKIDWSKRKLEYGSKLPVIIDAIANPEQKTQLAKIVNYYIEIQDELNNQNKSSKLISSIKAAAYAALLTSELNFDDFHVTCKSGKDRTAVLFLMIIALMHKNSVLTIEKALSKALDMGPDAFLTSLNITGGGSALQIDHDVLDELSADLTELLKNKQPRKVGQLASSVFECKTEIAAYLAKYARSEIKAAENNLLFPTANHGQAIKTSALTTSPTLHVSATAKPGSMDPNSSWNNLQKFFNILVAADPTTYALAMPNANQLILQSIGASAQPINIIANKITADSYKLKIPNNQENLIILDKLLNNKLTGNMSFVLNNCPNIDVALQLATDPKLTFSADLLIKLEQNAPKDKFNHLQQLIHQHKPKPQSSHVH